MYLKVGHLEERKDKKNDYVNNIIEFMTTSYKKRQKGWSLSYKVSLKA